MAVMRRGASWSFAVWVPAHDDVPRRQVARGGYRTKWDALSAERRFLVELEDDAAVPTELAGPKVGEFLVEWLVSSEPTRRPTTSVSYERCVRDHVLPHLGHVRLRELAPEHVRSWQAVLLRTPRRFRDGPLSTTTVRYCHRLLRRALQDALRWELIDRNVCDAVVAPRRADTEMTVWSPPEVRRFLAFVADDRLVAMWRLFLVTGMRRGEVAGLRWIDVDLEAGRLSVQHTRVLVYSAPQVSEPKTKRSRRVIALDAGTVDALREHQARQGAERDYAQDVWAESGYVFVREDGTPIDPDRISHLFRVAVEAAGLPKIRLHDLRHTAASLALAMGIHPKVVSERLGHSSVAITLDTYSHLTPGLQEDAADRLGEILDVDDVQTYTNVWHATSVRREYPGQLVAFDAGRAPIRRTSRYPEVLMTTRRTYTVREVAEMLGISRSTAYLCIRARGEIPSLTLGRRVVISKMAFDAFLAAHTPATAPAAEKDPQP